MFCVLYTDTDIKFNRKVQIRSTVHKPNSTEVKLVRSSEVFICEKMKNLAEAHDFDFQVCPLLYSAQTPRILNQTDSYFFLVTSSKFKLKCGIVKAFLSGAGFLYPMSYSTTQHRYNKNTYLKNKLRTN